MALQNFIIPRAVFYTLQISKIPRFGSLRPSKTCFSLKRGAISPIFMFFKLLSKMFDFCLQNDLVLRHLDDLKRSQNHLENQAYFCSHFRNILASKCAPRGTTFFLKNGVKMRVMAPGGPKVVILDHVGPHWEPKVVILDHCGPHFGAFWTSF